MESPYINNNSNHITGCSSGLPSDSYADRCTYAYANFPKGTGSSTSGTIYGIYDMNGGAWEQVMGVYNKNIRLSGFNDLPEDRYYDNYTTDIITTSCLGGICYGHALSETNEWYLDMAIFVNTDYTWIRRGGLYYKSGLAGIFYFDYAFGNGGNGDTFRVVLLD